MRHSRHHSRGLSRFEVVALLVVAAACIATTLPIANTIGGKRKRLQSMNNLVQQQTIHAGRPPLDPRSEGAPKLQTKSIPSASFSNTPTLNVEPVCQENLMAPTNLEGPKNERIELKESNPLKGTTAAHQG